MGTWSHDAFGNDSACDWAYELDERQDLSVVEQAINAVLHGEAPYVEASSATDALAAIEVLARLRGHFGFSNSYTERVDQWVRRARLVPPMALIDSAKLALEKITGDESELKDLWEEAGELDAWRASVEELRGRLLATPQPIRADEADDNQSSADSGVDADGDIADIVRRIGQINFASPEIPHNAQPMLLYRAIMIVGALCDPPRTRELIARIWQPIANMDNESILFDLAVREAQSWAQQGKLDAALAGLEAWRGASAAVGGQFETRASGVCLAGRDLDRTRAYHIKAREAAPDNLMIRIDRILFEARLGSVEVARELLAQEDLKSLPEVAQGGLTLIEGVLACRNAEPEAVSLMVGATKIFLAHAESSPAAWSLLALCCGWLALALDQANRRAEARALLAPIATVFMRLHCLDLIATLKERGVLPEDVTMPTFPIVPAQGADVRCPGTAQNDHGVFKTFSARGVNALMRVQALRREFAAGSRLYPFLIGDEKDLAQLLQLIAPPQDGGHAFMQAARELDVAAWLDEHMPKAAKSWPKSPLPPLQSPLTQFNVVDQVLKPEILIGLIELDDPCELFARMGFGDWNDCPPPPMHMALHAHWQLEYGAEPIAVSSDVVECMVARPPADRKAALHLAREHHGYCHDIVEQGTETTARLASTLLGAKYWYFWWD